MTFLVTIASALLLCSQVAPVLATTSPLVIGEEHAIRISSVDVDSDIAPVVTNPDDGRSIKKTYTIFHQNASYIALHFSQMDLDTISCILEVRDASGGQLYVMTGHGRHDLSTFWAHHVEGDTAVLSSYCKGLDKKADFVVDKYVSGFTAHEIYMLSAQDRKRNLSGDKNELFPLEGRDLTMCGANDMRNAQCYDGTTEYTKAKAVARLIIQGKYSCTGWLLGPNNYLVTNNHCISTNEAAINTDYDFMYEVTGGGDCSTQPGYEPVNSWPSYDAKNLVLTSVDKDYSVISLEDNPAGIHGYLEMDDRVAAVGEKIYIPQHPATSDKAIAIYDSELGTNERCEVKNNSGGSFRAGAEYADIRYSCDTEGGSSGSPVLSVTNHKVVALHYAGGGCGGNTGVSIKEIHREIQDAVDGATAPPTSAPPVCPEDKYAFNLELTTDGYPTETSWTLEDNAGNLVASGSGYTMPNQDIEAFECLESGEHKFTIRDGWGDGICCSSGNGSYKVFYDGAEIASGGSFQAQDVVFLGGADVSKLIATTEDITPLPTITPTPEPTQDPTFNPTPGPTLNPTPGPTHGPTPGPTFNPTPGPTHGPTPSPTPGPTPNPTPDPTLNPTPGPTFNPTPGPTLNPTPAPSPGPTQFPTQSPTAAPTPEPTTQPTLPPTFGPTQAPSPEPTPLASGHPTDTFAPSKKPTPVPTLSPTPVPTPLPSHGPTPGPTPGPTFNPTPGPTFGPTPGPTPSPTPGPTHGPTPGPTHGPTPGPTFNPTPGPTFNPTPGPTFGPTPGPTPQPSANPTPGPTVAPTPLPTQRPTPGPTPQPSAGPTQAPTPLPTFEPTLPVSTRKSLPISSAPGSKGDPHFKTWKQEHFEYHGQCDLVLTKDPTFANGLGLEVQIRTKLIRFWSYIKSAAIYIGDDILEVQGNADPEETENIYWINFEYQKELKTIGGFPVTVRDYDTIKRVFEIHLDSMYPGQKIVIAYFKEFVKVSFENANEEAFGNTVGLLGDYKTGKTLARDGVTVLDDFYEFGKEWQVLPSEIMLFHDVEQPQFPQRCIEPEDPQGDRRRRLEESSVSEAEAEKACASIADPLDRKDCIYDVMATQDLDMVGAY